MQSTDSEPRVSPLSARRVRGLANPSGREALATLVLLVVLVWVARYWHRAHFGLYEDDYTKVSQALSMTWGGVWHQVGQAFLYLSDHGKPLHTSLILLLSFVSGKLGGLRAAYGLGFGIYVGNCLLFYALLRRLSSTAVASVGALAYGLFSSDISQAFLTHAFGLQTSMMFLLLALHLFLSGRRILAYAVIALVLITYETPYPVFLVAPLLAAQWNRNLLRDILKHALVLAGLMAFVIVLRFLVGESRVSDLGLLSGIRISVMHMVLGPLATVGMYMYRPIQALRSLDLEAAVAVLLALGLLMVVLPRLRIPPTAAGESLIHRLRAIRLRSVISSMTHGRVPGELEALLTGDVRLGIVGAAMLVLAYPLTFTLSALEVAGRATRVHLAAGLGASILFAVLVCGLQGTIRSLLWRRWLWLAVAGLLALQVGFGLVVQRDYVRSWQEQRSFWTQVVRLCPDLREGTVVLVDPTGLQDTTQIGANTWNLPRILDQVYAFPEGWPEPPRVFRLAPGWQAAIMTEDGRFRLDATTVSAPPSLYRTVDSLSVILLTSASGQLARQPGPLVIGDDAFVLQTPAAEPQTQLTAGPLYALLIEEGGP
jgi:hypothetical protein